MQDNFRRFDIAKKPMRQWLRPVIWALSFPAVWKHKAKITKVRMEGIKPPYFLLCSHNSFLDFKVVSAAIFPERSNNIVAIDGFISPLGKRFISREWLLRLVGCICKRKFTNDITLVRHLKRVAENGDIAVIYPEARYSLCGTPSALPESLGKMCRMFKIPVVTMITRGHHVTSPFWNKRERNAVPTEAVMTCIFNTDEIAAADTDQINEKIAQMFQYDDFAWQRDNKISVTYKKRAEGLHKVLYQCPACRTEYRISSSGDRLTCTSCGKSWTMDEYGILRADSGGTEYTHIPDWYEWQRSNVREEVLSGKYHFSGAVRVKSLPNSKGFVDLGEGMLTHNADGFKVAVAGKYGEFEMTKSVRSMYACHIEYDYLDRYGDCIDLNTLEDTWYIYPQGNDFAVTKMALAAEELYAGLGIKI